MATKKASGKSILKQPKTQTPPANDNSQTGEEAEAEAEAAAKKKRHFDIAIKHALLIDHQKKVSSQILEHIEKLLDFPASTEPRSEDAAKFVELVSIFQPSNFDELVEERRIDGKCGYPLCLNEPRGLRLKDSESWKLKKGAGDWCSDDCARKGLFIKAQLCEVPAWERVPGQQPPAVLHEDDRHLLPSMVSGNDSQAKKVKQRVAERSELAMERGETSMSFRPDQVMADFVVEKTPPAPTASKVKFAAATSSTAIEGYEPMTSLENTNSLPPAAEVAALLKVPNAKETTAGEVESDDTDDDDDDEDQQWKDMMAHVRKRG